MYHVSHLIYGSAFKREGKKKPEFLYQRRKKWFVAWLLAQVPNKLCQQFLNTWNLERTMQKK